MLDLVNIRARNIDDAYFLLLRNLFQRGKIYIVERGSYEGHKRLEFDYLTLQITNPEDRPLSPIVPQGIPPVTTEEDIYNYTARYIFGETKEKNEEYTYADYIVPQIPKIINILKEGGAGTNQAIISVCDVKSIDLKHPPCLRQIQCKINNEKLDFFTYWRSHDLFSGFPENMGGLQLLKEYIANELNVLPGETIESSFGAHAYDITWSLALARLGGVMPEDSVITKEEAELGERWMPEGE